MLILFGLWALGGLLLGAAILLIPYHRRFLRRLDRGAFVFTTGTAGLTGAGLVASAGSFIWMQIL